VTASRGQKVGEEEGVGEYHRWDSDAISKKGDRQKKGEKDQTYVKLPESL
jgi:hypothetical protein